MVKNINDVEQAMCEARFDLDKAMVLLDDVADRFTGDLEHPGELEVECIRRNYKRISLKLALMWDVLDSIGEVLQMVDSMQENCAVEQTT